MNKKEWKEFLVESFIFGILGVITIIIVSNLLKIIDRGILLGLFILLFFLIGLIIKITRRKKK